MPAPGAASFLAGWLPRYPPRGCTPAPIRAPPAGFPGEKLAGASFWMGVCRNGIANAGASAASHPACLMGF